MSSRSEHQVAEDSLRSCSSKPATPLSATLSVTVPPAAVIAPPRPSATSQRGYTRSLPSSGNSPAASVSPRLRSPQPATRGSSRSIFSFWTTTSGPPSSIGEDSVPGGSLSSSAESLGSVKSFRTTSSTSPVYMFKNAMKSSKQLPFEYPELSDQEFETFAKLAKDQQTLDAPGLWGKSSFRLVYLLALMSFVYFVLVGFPLWQGGARWFWNFYHDEADQSHVWGLIAFLVIGTIRNLLPQILCTFERSEPESDSEKPRDSSECCVIIPCYKSAETLHSTLPACLKIFGPEQIFVVANGSSPTPLDHTADVCAQYGVRHYWVPVGSKITAEFVGVALAGRYKYCMLIDDDVLLPANLPLPTDRFGSAEDKIACVGYTIKSVGTDSSRGTMIQQVQDIEYKLAGLAKVCQTHYGSVVFPHGAVALWRRDILEKIFHGHPGYHISEDWFLGHTARAAGYRMVMSSQVFVETETPPRLFPAWFGKKGGSRGGYGEMSIYKQRFFRWNFFFVFRMWSNVAYILFSWRLGWRELFTKLYVFGECYDSLIWLCAPIVLPISFATSWKLTLVVTGGLLAFNFLIICWFQLVHLMFLRRGRAIDERLSWKAFPAYMYLKFVMLFVNIASIYWSIYEYAFFFTQQHLRVTESVAAWQVIKGNMHHS